MEYFKTVIDGIIYGIGKSEKGNITEAEYNAILSVIKSKPPVTETTDCRLREDLTWEEYSVEPPDPEPEIDVAEAWEILFGGGEA